MTTHIHIYLEKKQQQQQQQKKKEKEKTFAQSVWNLHKEIPCLSLRQLSAFVCKLLSVPVYPQRCNNQTSHIAKGSSEGT